MDTRLKKFNPLMIKKAVAVVLCLLCVAGCAHQVFSSLIVADETVLFDVAFRDALNYGGKSIGQNEITGTKTFKNHFKEYVQTLSEMIGRYGEGTEKDYEKWKKSIESSNAVLKKSAKENLISHVIADDFMTYLDLVEDGTVSPAGFIQAAEYSGNNHDFDENCITGEVDYRYLCTNKGTTYNVDAVPKAVQKKAEELKADGVFEINNYYKIIREDDETGFGNVTATYQPGYYAFKINEDVLWDRLIKTDMLQRDNFGSAEEFNSRYRFYADDIAKKYSRGKYFIKDGNGTIYTNMKGLSEKSTKEEISEAFSGLGFYTIGDIDGTYRLPNGDLYGFNEFFRDNYNTSYDEYYGYSYYGGEYNPVVTTTVVYETTTLPSQVSTTMASVEVTNRNGEVEATSVQVSVPEPTTGVYFSVDSTPFLKESAESWICFMGVDMNAGEYPSTDRFLNTASQIEKAQEIVLDTVFTCGSLALLFIICFIYLIVNAGRKKGDEEVHLLRTDKMFTDWRIAIDCGLGGLLFLLFVAATDFFGDKTVNLFLIIITLIVTAFSAVVLDLVLFITRHIKARSFLKMLFPVWVVKKSFGFYKDKVKPFVDEKFLYTKEFAKGTLVRVGIVAVVNILLGFFGTVESASNGTFFLYIVWVLFDIGVLVWTVRFVGGMHKIFSVLEEIRQGNYNVHINIYSLPETLRESGNKVMNLRDGLKTAVEEAVKQEQTKTELITNVSHDLKTPLTSIINYVELLKKCDISDGDAKEYLDVLSEKGDRLKKLIEDLVEASKASTGNIKVDMVEVSLNEMVSQLLGEHADGLEKRRLNVVAEIPEENLIVKADGKLLYRVMENLIVNVEKYSLYGTRVYVTVKKEGAYGTVTFKNISEQPLNITADQLKERFVRGDESRSTEGNGLGLSIAQSLCDVQGGELEISINGDLFTAKVILKK